jgi:hypothetical protein
MRRGAPVRDWASFAVIGDPTMRVRLEAPSRARWWWIAAALGAVAIVIGAGVVVRRRAVRTSRAA